MIQIVNADDFGKSKQINDAIVLCFNRKLISSTTIMSNMDSFEDAVQKAKIHKINSIGLHFNLTEGFPLSTSITKCNRFCNSEGQFIYKRNSHFFLSKKEQLAIKEEFEAQLLKVKEAGINVTHIDSHQHIHTEPFIFFSIKDILKKEKIVWIRPPRNNVNKILSPKNLYKEALKLYLKCYGFKFVDSFVSLYNNNILQSKKHNKSIEYMCHPTFLNKELYDAVESLPINTIIKNIRSYKDLQL